MTRLGSLLVLLAACLWGSNGLFVAALGAYGLESGQYTAVRVLAAFMGALVWQLVAERRVPRVSGAELAWLAVNGVVGVFLFSYTYGIAIQLTSMATAAVLIYLMPSIVTAWSVVCGRERLTPLKVACLALSLVACALVSGLATGGIVGSAAGIACGLVAALCFSANNIVQGGPLSGLTPRTVLVYTFGFASVAAVAHVLVSGGAAQALATYAAEPMALIVNVAYGLTCSLATYFLYNTALRMIPLGQAATLATFEPVAASVLGVALLGEELTAAMLAGIGLEVVALVLLQASPKGARGPGHVAPPAGGD